jgi:hypothetical protein
MLAVDPHKRGLTARQFLAGLYPPKEGDDRDSVRSAVEAATRTFPGRTPEARRIAALWSKREGDTILGGRRVDRGKLDPESNTVLWIAVMDTEAKAPLSALPDGKPSAPNRPPRKYEEDTPSVRGAIEMEVGKWLSAHAQELPIVPIGPLQVISAARASADATELFQLQGSVVCVAYTRNIRLIDNCVRIGLDVWAAIGQARKAGARIFVSFCSDDDTGLLTFDEYDRIVWAPEDMRQIENNILSFPANLLTYVRPSTLLFKEVVPHIWGLRSMRQPAVGASTAIETVTKMDQSLLRNDVDLCDAIKRGWLLTPSRPDDNHFSVSSVWSRYCDIQRIPNLYACHYQTGRGVVPGRHLGHVRLDLGGAGISFSDPQIEALIDRLRPFLDESEMLALRPTATYLSVVCSGNHAERIAKLIFEAVSQLRPKHLRRVSRLSPGTPGPRSGSPS